MTFHAGRGAVWVLRGTLVVADVILTVTIVVLSRWLPFWIRWCCPIPTLVLLPLFFLYVPKLVHSLYGRVDRSAVNVSYGLLWQREIYAPLEALRTYEIWMPPLHRAFRCRTVVLRFAGGSAWLPLLDRTDVERLTTYFEVDEERT